MFKISVGPTWYLLVELKGISATFVYLSLISFTDPQQSSIHFRRADSEASPATSLFEEDKSIRGVNITLQNTIIYHYFSNVSLLFKIVRTVSQVIS